MNETTEKQSKLLGLPYEIRTMIFKRLLLRDVKSLALTNESMLDTYVNMNQHMSDKISFKSSTDRFKQCFHLKNFKEITLDFFATNITYDDCISFCMKQRQIEKIKIHDITYDGISASVALHKSINLKNLTVLEIDFLIEPRDDADYLLPFVQSTTALRKLTYKNGILNKESMKQISRNVELKSIRLQNVFIFNVLSLKEMLCYMRNLRTFHYFYFHFTRLMTMVRTLEALFDMTSHMPCLTDFKISVWQELNLPFLNQTNLFTRQYQAFKLVQGNASPFFRAIIPLVNSFRLSDFELLYLNESFPSTEREKATIKYTITDNESRTLKFYNYTTE